jgi:hypothetical protein
LVPTAVPFERGGEGVYMHPTCFPAGAIPPEPKITQDWES